ncbi:HdeD family acid-resistance protein [Microbacterium panaciterrae]|uniref:HdeD family acid-resistance protein n=1 Tax=Microbacterium panaciterrae TaxID=985759 RepID=A0ABP8P8D3_9MICO
MSEAVAEAKSLVKSLRLFLAISGVIALIAGLVMLIWPVKTAFVLTGIVAAYLIVAGVVYVGLGIFGAGKSGWARLGHIVLGVLYIVAGVIAFANIQAAAVAFALVTVIFIGVSWLLDGVVSLTLMGQDGSRTWTLLYALLSIVAGIAVISLGLAAVPFFWLFLAISLVVLGIAQILRAITIGKNAKTAAGALGG